MPKAPTARARPGATVASAADTALIRQQGAAIRKNWDSVLLWVGPERRTR